MWGGKVFAEGKNPSTSFDLDRWMKTLPAAMDRGDGSDRFHQLDL
jgi:hypothetical protein